MYINKYEFRILFPNVQIMQNKRKIGILLIKYLSVMCKKFTASKFNFFTMKIICEKKLRNCGKKYVGKEFVF